MGRIRTTCLVALVAMVIATTPASADICNGRCPDGRGRGRGSGGFPGNTAPGQFSISDDSVMEGPPPPGDDGNLLVFTVTLTGGSGPASVRYATRDGTATEMGQPGDYFGGKGKLNFAGPGKKRIRFLVVDDDIPEPDETMFVKLRKPVGAEIADGRGRGTIRNDD